MNPDDQIITPILRNAWLENRHRREDDVMRDDKGEYVCLDEGWIGPSIKCELVEYLPKHLQKKV